MARTRVMQANVTVMSIIVALVSTTLILVLPSDFSVGLATMISLRGTSRAGGIDFRISDMTHSHTRF
eukprot:42596-Prymnesium_polylepis.1